MAHARRKFFELHATNKSTLAEQALRYIQLLYEVESEVRDLEPDLRRRIPNTARKSRAGDGCPACLDDRLAPDRARRLGYRQSFGLHPQTLDGSVALSR